MLVKHVKNGITGEICHWLHGCNTYAVVKLMSGNFTTWFISDICAVEGKGLDVAMLEDCPHDEKAEAKIRCVSPEFFRMLKDQRSAITSTMDRFSVTVSQKTRAYADGRLNMLNEIIGTICNLEK